VATRREKKTLFNEATEESTWLRPAFSWKAITLIENWVAPALGSMSEMAIFRQRTYGALAGIAEGKLTAGATNNFVSGAWLREPEAVAKSALLANHGINVHTAERKRKDQLHDLGQGNFKSQHGWDSGFTDVYRITLQQAAGLGIDTDIDLDFEPSLPTGIGNRSMSDSFGLILTFEPCSLPLEA
jgi:hypothetical protein